MDCVAFFHRRKLRIWVVSSSWKEEWSGLATSCTWISSPVSLVGKLTGWHLREPTSEGSCLSLWPFSFCDHLGPAALLDSSSHRTLIPNSHTVLSCRAAVTNHHRPGGSSGSSHSFGGQKSTVKVLSGLAPCAQRWRLCSVPFPLAWGWLTSLCSYLIFPPWWSVSVSRFSFLKRTSVRLD